MTHGFLYGTATFEGIRAYWNEEQASSTGSSARALHASVAVGQGDADEATGILKSSSSYRRASAPEQPPPGRVRSPDAL